MIRRILMLLMLTPFIGQLSGSAFTTPPSIEPITSGRVYYRPLGSGASIYKMEAIRLMVTPQMTRLASGFSTDGRIRELIEMAQGLDVLGSEGFRMVRTRGVLDNVGAVDAYAIKRVMYYFETTETEARAWLVASRLMQMSGYKDDGVALTMIELELTDTAADLLLRLKTYFGVSAYEFLPHYMWMWGIKSELPKAPEKPFTVTMPDQRGLSMPMYWGLQR